MFCLSHSTQDHARTRGSLVRIGLCVCVCVRVFVCLQKQKQPKTANNQANANVEPEEPGDAYKIVKMIMKKNYDPVSV